MKKQSILLNFLTIVCISLVSVKSEANNSCRTDLGYFNRNGGACFYSPDFYKHPPELIEKYAGKSETHYVLTKDGYNLTIFRIPRENPRGVILMQHPVTVDSRVWLMQFNESTALFFWQAGYDVWMPNNRGTYYARNHVNLTRHDKKFWNFSFHEIGIYDHPASVDYIRSKTNGSTIIFISHSMSTTSSLVYAAMKSEEAAESIALMVQMSPIILLKNINDPGYKILARFVDHLKGITDGLGLYSILDYDSFIVNIVMNFGTGWTPQDADPKFYNMAVSQFPSELSVKCFAHLGQILRSKGRFQMFDHGSKKNMQIYNSTKPPEYPLGDIKVPQMLIYSKDDLLATPKDSVSLYKALPQKARHSQLQIDGVNHITFHFSKDRMQKIYKPILATIMDLEQVA